MRVKATITINEEDIERILRRRVRNKLNKIIRQELKAIDKMSIMSSK